MGTITWTASNNSSFLNGEREAKTMTGAVRAARQYVRGELMGEGKITIMEDGVPVREDRCDMFTGYRWESRHIA